MFFSKLTEDVKDFVTDADKSIIVGGDFNVIFDQDLDGRGGNKKRKDSVRYVEDMIIEHDLLDIWRIRNPTDTRFTWRQKSPLIQRRLDYWLISNDLQEDVESVEIKSAIRSDHSAITLSVNGLEENERGPSFWKFNSTLINDQEYCDLLRLEYKNWLEEFKDVNDKRVLWDLVAPEGFRPEAKSRGGTLVARAYIKDSIYSSNMQSVYRKNLDLLEQGPRGIGR